MEFFFHFHKYESHPINRVRVCTNFKITSITIRGICCWACNNIFESLQNAMSFVA